MLRAYKVNVSLKTRNNCQYSKAKPQRAQARLKSKIYPHARRLASPSVPYAIPPPPPGAKHAYQNMPEYNKTCKLEGSRGKRHCTSPAFVRQSMHKIINSTATSKKKRERTEWKTMGKSKATE